MNNIFNDINIAVYTEFWTNLSVPSKFRFFIFPLKQAENSIAGQNGQIIFQNRQKISFSAHVRGLLDY